MLTPSELDTMIYQFDKDGDGQLDLMEFQDFIAQELESLNFDATNGEPPKIPPSPKALSRDPSRVSLNDRPIVLGLAPGQKDPLESPPKQCKIDKGASERRCVKGSRKQIGLYKSKFLPP